MKIKNHWFGIFAILLLSSSCHNSYYLPKEMNDLKLQNKHDLQAAASFSPHSYYNLQLGYSPIRHIGLYASRFKRDIQLTSPHTTPAHSIHSEWKENMVGLGSYIFFNTKGNPPKKYNRGRVSTFNQGILLDGYLNYSFGQWGYDFISALSGNNFAYDFYFKKISFQTGLHFQKHYGGISLFYKIGSSTYHKGDVTGKVGEEHLEIIYSILNKNQFTPHTLGINFNFGVKSIRTYFNFTMTVNDFDQLDNNPYYISNVGMALNLNQIYQSFKNR